MYDAHFKEKMEHLKGQVLAMWAPDSTPKVTMVLSLVRSLAELAWTFLSDMRLWLSLFWLNILRKQIKGCKTQEKSLWISKGRANLLLLYIYNVSEIFILIFVSLQVLISNYLKSLEHDFSFSFSLFNRPYRECVYSFTWQSFILNML